MLFCCACGGFFESTFAWLMMLGTAFLTAIIASGRSLLAEFLGAFRELRKRLKDIG